jgi:hypothetical protein
MMAASLAAEPMGLGKPHSGFTIVAAPPDVVFGKNTSFHTREYRGRRARCEGGETLCVTSWSMRTRRPGHGRTNAPVPLAPSRNSVSASHRVAIQVAFESKGLKPGFHFIVSRVETRRFQALWGN